ncbi:MAG: PIG-L family deacetylase, partial [Thermaerobacterales bacterium]
MSLIGRLAGIADWALQTRELWLVLAALLALVWWRHRGFLTWLRNLVLSENLTLHPDDRILVFAPHCDDETLGAGGILHTAGRLGCARKVVLLTNGDGFRYGVSGRFHRLRPSPE